MLSDSIKYKDLRSEKHTYKSAIGSKRIKKSLYYIPADCKSAGTIALLVYIRRHIFLNSSLPGSHKAIVLSDMLSGSKKYKDLRSEKHTYKSAIGSKRIENPYIQFRQIFRCAQQHVQISRHISFVAACPFLNYNAFDSNYSNFYNYFNY